MEKSFWTSIITNLIPEDATPGIIVLFLFIAYSIYALSKANIIYDFVNRFSTRELTNLKNIIADENISKTEKTLLREKIKLINYQKRTGIKTNNIYIHEQIIEYYRLARGRLRYSDFKKAFALLKIDENDVLIIRDPNIAEKIAHIWFIISSTFFLGIILLLLTALIYFLISIQQQIFLFLSIICLGIIFVVFADLTSLIPAAKRIKNEIRRNKLIVQRNRRKIELRQIQITKGRFPLSHEFEENIMDDTLSLPFHPLSHFSMEERQHRIKQVLGVWQDDAEIDAIFAEIDRDRHSYRGRRIDSLDD